MIKSIKSYSTHIFDCFEDGSRMRIPSHISTWRTYSVNWTDWDGIGRHKVSILLNETFLKGENATHIYIYIYIFTNLLSTSIHGYQEKRKKKRQESEIKISRIIAQRKKEKISSDKKKKKKKKRPNPSHQLKKIKRYAISWSKEK